MKMSVDDRPLGSFDPLWPEFVADPYPFYLRLMTNDPVHKVDSSGVWWVTTYADVLRVLGWREFSNEAPIDSQHPQPEVRLAYDVGIPRHMILRDPPDHVRLRSLVSRSFTPGVVEGMRGRVSEIADELLDRVESRGGSMDLIEDFAFPLPAMVIAELVGIPSEDRTRFRVWSEQMVRAVDDTQPEVAIEEAGRGLRELVKYLEELIEARRQDKRDDLLSNLIAVEEKGDRLSTSELITMIALLINAGHETTTSLIGTGILALLENHAQLDLLRSEEEHMRTAVEELLRYQSPVQRLRRYALADTEIGGKLVRKGDAVEAIIAAANRDHTVFKDPDHLDITRAINPHLAFGRGIHLCLGAPLVRVEAPVAFQALLQRFPHLSLDGIPRWKQNTRVRGLASLPLAF
jgi:pimeloyl-[acyl-carrier protein] synthase